MSPYSQPYWSSDRYFKYVLDLTDELLESWQIYQCLYKEQKFTDDKAKVLDVMYEDLWRV